MQDNTAYTVPPAPVGRFSGNPGLLFVCHLVENKKKPCTFLRTTRPEKTLGSLLIIFPDPVDPLFHLPPDCDAAAGVIVDKYGKDEKMVFFCNKIAAKRSNTRQAPGLRINIAGILFVIGGKCPRPAGWQDTLHPGQPEFLHHLV